MKEREKHKGIFHVNGVFAVCGRVRKAADRVKGVKRGG